MEEAKQGFLAHLAAYIILNPFLIFLNLYLTPQELWFQWPLVGWGVGLAFHFVFSRERWVVRDWEKKVGKIELRLRKKSENLVTSKIEMSYPDL